MTINEETLEIHCKDTYQLIIDHFTWANVTPTLHKVLAHSVELMSRFNEGRGIKAFSEGLESCNKHIRRYRELLVRKETFEDNIRDVFARLLCQSNYVSFLQRKNIELKHRQKTGYLTNEELFLRLIRE